ncbi:hypothetical protein JCM8097_003097 [Rhodosporidiobolus ruineniae]
MDSTGPDDAFRLGRLRLIRLPPEWIALPAGAKRAVTVPVELAVGVTDDYGVDLDMFDSLNLQLQLLDAATLKPPSGVTLALDGASSSSPASSTAVLFTFTPSRGPFHTLKLSITFSSSSPTNPPPPRLAFRLAASASPPSCPSSAAGGLSPETRRIRRLLGEPAQKALETWDDKRYVFLSVQSGPVEVRTQGKEVKVAGSKGTHALTLFSAISLTPGRTVQTALRSIYLFPNQPSSAHDSSAPSPAPRAAESSSASSITIVERPGLNNSTGQRLWDCAIGLSTFFSLHHSALDASLPLPTSPSSDSFSSSTTPSTASEPVTKRARLESEPGRRRKKPKVIELGAGCALASMAVKRLSPDLVVLASDVEATVETTLQENLAANSLDGSIEAQVLDWDELDAARVDELVGGASSLTLIGTDILYNPSSHSLLLSTLISFLRPSSPPIVSSIPTRALIAYKRRTDGDDAFFDLAREAGLRVECVWRLGEVSVWSFEGP